MLEKDILKTVDVKLLKKRHITYCLPWMEKYLRCCHAVPPKVAEGCTTSSRHARNMVHCHFE